MPKTILIWLTESPDFSNLLRYCNLIFEGLIDASSAEEVGERRDADDVTICK